MKQIALFLAILNFHFLSFSQENNLFIPQQPIYINVTNDLASKVLQQLSDQIGQSISYNSDLLTDRQITLRSEKMTLTNILQFIFANDQILVRNIGNQLVIYEKATRPILLDSCHHKLTGQLIDPLTNDGLAHATIKELNSDQLTVTNTDGQFYLSIPSHWDSVHLEISALGYHTKHIIQVSHAEIGTIEMQGDYVALQEVIIMSMPAEHLIDQVLNHVKDNYMDKPTNATAFFRDVILKNEKIASMSEAVFETYSPPYFHLSKTDQVHLVKGRKFSNPNYLDTIEFKIKGSLASCLALDIVKHPPLFFNLESYKNTYEYTFKDVIEYNGRDIYVIDFKHRFGADGLPYHGTMYIDKERLSLMSVDFSLDKKTMRNIENHFVLKKSRGTKTKLQSAQYHVNYTEVDNKLMMNYASLRTSFKVKKKDNLFSAQYETISEYVVNQIRFEKVTKIRPRNSFNKDDIFMEQPMSYDENYWNGISFLPIDKPLDNASEELKKILSVK